MNRALVEEIAGLGGDPTDLVWEWLLKRGPHGSDFTWGQARREPAGYVGVVHLQEIVEEQSDLDPTFLNRAKAAVGLALRSENPKILRRAIQVASVLGSEEEIKVISSIVKHGDVSVAADARACTFHLKNRLG